MTRSRFYYTVPSGDLYFNDIEVTDIKIIAWANGTNKSYYSLFKVLDGEIEIRLCGDDIARRNDLNEDEKRTILDWWKIYKV